MEKDEKVKKPISKQAGSRTVDAGTIEGVSRADAFKIDPMKIIIDDEFNYNPREDYSFNNQEWEDFKKSILTLGVQVPLEVYIKNNKPYLGHGFRRLKAVHELHEEGFIIDLVPFLQVQANQVKLLYRHFILNNGKVLEPAERAKGIHHLITVLHESIEDVSRNTFMPVAQINDYLSVYGKASGKLKDAMSKGEVTYNTAKSIVESTDTAIEQIAQLSIARANALEANQKKHQSTKAVETDYIDTDTGEVLSDENVTDLDVAEGEPKQVAMAPEPVIRILPSHVPAIVNNVKKLSFEKKLRNVLHEARQLDSTDKSLITRIEHLVDMIQHEYSTESDILSELFSTISVKEDI